VKRGIRFSRRVVCLFSLLVLHTVGIAGGSVAIATADSASAGAAGGKAVHCPNHTQDHAAVLADRATSVTDCSGCCPSDQACQGPCACAALAACANWGVAAQLTPSPPPRPNCYAGSQPPQPPPRIFRPPII
jgi:hypothetical protein